MAKGICSNCGKTVGGMLGPKGFACPGCGKAYCATCSPKVGTIFKNPTCKDCGRPLQRF